MDDRQSRVGPIAARRRFLIGGLVGAMALSSVPAQAAEIDGVTSIVSRLRSMRRFDRAAVEAAIGIALRDRGNEGNPYFTTSRGGPATIDGLPMSAIELREPLPGRGATAGPILILTIGRDCADRREVERRFGPLAVTATPRGRSPSEQLVLSRDETLGRLSFGFADSDRDCLKSLSLSGRRP